MARRIFSDQTEQRYWRIALLAMNEDSSLDDEGRTNAYWNYRDSSMGR